MPNYREAKCIELHDSNVALTLEDESYAYTALIGRTQHSDKPAYRVNLSDICMIAEALGIRTNEEVRVPTSSDQTIATVGTEHRVDNIEIPIFKAHYDYSDSDRGEKIVKLECEVLTDRLVNIRVTSTMEDEKPPYIEEITYSGPFTLWWKSGNS